MHFIYFFPFFLMLLFVAHLFKQNLFLNAYSQKIHENISKISLLFLKCLDLFGFFGSFVAIATDSSQLLPNNTFHEKYLFYFFQVLKFISTFSDRLQQEQPNLSLHS